MLLCTLSSLVTFTDEESVHGNISNILEKMVYTQIAVPGLGAFSSTIKGVHYSDSWQLRSLCFKVFLCYSTA